MEKNPTLLLGGYRLIYGFVTIIVLLAGMSNVSMKKFGIMAAISNLLWVVVVGSLSYFCADLLMENIDWAKQNSGYIIGGLALIGILYWFFVKRKEMNMESEAA